MSDNTIYEISQLMKNPESLNNDIVTALNLIGEHFKNKYVKPIQGCVENHYKICSGNPSPRLALLQACKPFISSGGNNTFQQITNFFTTCQILESIKKEYASNLVTTAQIQDPAIHPDGVYEIDKSCIVNSSNLNQPTQADLLLITLALLLIFTGN